MKTLVIVCLMLMLVPAMTFAGDDKCDDSCSDVSGFVDASYWGNMDEQGHEFSLDQAEIDVERCMDDVGIVLRVDFEWVNDGAGGFNEGLEQGYMNYTLPFMPSMNFTFGKFNAPIGFELLDPVDMYQYSHSLVFVNCLPTNLTGAMGNMALGESLDLAVYVANGWDNNVENNSTKTVGGRLGFTTDRLAIGGSGIMGVFDDDQLMSRTVFDVDFGFTVTDEWLIGGEYNMGTIATDLPGAEDVGWTAFLVMTHYEINEWLGLTGRYDMIDDADGSIFGIVPGTTEGTTWNSITVAPTFHLGCGLEALVEYRIDSAGEDMFLDSDGKPASSTSTAAFEMIYSFNVN